ncbi:Uncharacterised protein [Yersinia kristensenii]|nr:Uncharacterised protein [Yersinia kristensenii]
MDKNVDSTLGRVFFCEHDRKISNSQDSNKPPVLV